jgi:hypothetical protein
VSKNVVGVVLSMCTVSDCLLTIYESSPGSLPPRLKPVGLPLPLATGQTLSTAEYCLTDTPAYIYIFISDVMYDLMVYVYIYEYVPNSRLLYLYPPNPSGAWACRQH